jgi:hypothetical protein
VCALRCAQTLPRRCTDRMRTMRPRHAPRARTWSHGAALLAAVRPRITLCACVRDALWADMRPRAGGAVLRVRAGQRAGCRCRACGRAAAAAAGWHRRCRACGRAAAAASWRSLCHACGRATGAAGCRCRCRCRACGRAGAFARVAFGCSERALPLTLRGAHNRGAGTTAHQHVRLHTATHHHEHRQEWSEKPVHLARHV